MSILSEELIPLFYGHPKCSRLFKEAIAMLWYDDLISEEMHLVSQLPFGCSTKNYIGGYNDI